MIKNILYSLFLHLAFLFTIYNNFHSPEFDENKTSEISVSLVSMSGNQNSSSLKPLKKISKAREAKIEKKSQNNQPQQSNQEIKKTEQNFQNNEELGEKSPTVEEIIEEKEAIKEEVKDTKVTNASQSEISENGDEETANTIASLDLSAREKFNIQSQLKMCYSRAVSETQLESNIKISLKVQISIDGYISSNLDSVLDEERYENPKESNYKIAIDNAKRAIDLCSPMRNLPIEKYDIWKEVLLEFGGI